MQEAIDVLHVEDDPDFAALTAEFLPHQHEHFSVDSAASASEAIEMLEDNCYDCIVSDHDMPGRNGIEFLEGIRTDWPDLPFILFTGKGSEEVASRAISAGVTDYLQKAGTPEQFGLLANRITNSVEQSRATRELIHRDRKLEQLRERTQELAYTVTVQETLELAVEAADDIIEAPLSGCHLRSDDGSMLEPAAAMDVAYEFFDDLPSYERDAPPGSRAAFVWEAFEGDELVHVPSLSDHEPLEESTPTESVIIHPLSDRGIFIVSSPDPHAFSDTDVLLVEILANNLEVALDRVEREQEVRRREHRLERLHDATLDLMNSASDVEIADRIAMACEDILGFPIVSVRLFDESSEGLVPVVVSERAKQLLPERPVFTAEDTSLNWEAYDSGEAQVFDTADQLDETIDHDTPIQSFMIIPIGEYGTVSIGETTSGAFDSTDEYHARILAIAAETALRTQERADELRDQRDELERQNDRLDEFVRVVSHDLRSPLTAAHGWVELADEETDTEHLEAALDAIKRMETLTEDLLDLAQEGDEIGELEQVDLAEVAETAWQTVSTSDGTLRVESEGAYRGDASRLIQLLGNLLGNAIDHGGEDVTVVVGDLPEGAGFYVADDGVGISEIVREEVLEFGYSTGDGDRTGFGLAIVNQIATAHGWDLDVTETESGGARFEFTGVDRLE